MIRFFELLFDVFRHLGEKEKWDALIAFIGTPVFYSVLFAIIFCETGLVILPFLPGDSLLFAIGAMAAIDVLNLPFAIALLIVAAILGDALNYYIGYRIGPKVFTRNLENADGSPRKRSFFDKLLNRKHLLKAQAFYEKYGAKTIILARFVPIVRTFAPFVAGVGKMSYPKFALYNIIGAVAWVVLCTLAGYFFGAIPFVKKNFELVLLGIIFVSVIPVAVEVVLGYIRSKRGVDPLLDVVTLGESTEREEAGKLK
ncbi:MAG TPA: VTT domain-containing protein [Tepidisphaeraceae bacterium]|nr:VTT domain-containing protein [Tepidisphaeraceae bacterium]